jgi:serine/threonine protein kinase
MNVDIWALGCITYEMFCKQPPFIEDKISLMDNICEKQISFDHKVWNDISQDAKDFIL